MPGAADKNETVRENVCRMIYRMIITYNLNGSEANFKGFKAD